MNAVMDFSPLPLVAAYLGVWLVRGVAALWRLARARLNERNAAGKLQEMWSTAAREDEAWLCLAGLALGLVAASLLARWAPAGRVLPICLVVCLAFEELRTPRGLDTLPAVIALLSACRSDRDVPLLEVFAGIWERLSPGVVREATHQALSRFRQGQSPSACMEALAGIHPCLDEFIADAAYANWQAGPALNVVLEAVIHKALAEWNRTVAVRRFFEQAEAWLSLGRYAGVGGLVVCFFQVAAGDLRIVIIPPDWIGPAGILILLMGMGLYAALARPLLRRSLLAAALVWVGLWWLAPANPSAQALEPTPTVLQRPTRTPTVQIITLAPTVAITTTATPPYLSTATAPRQPSAASPAPGPKNAPATATAPPLLTATSPAIILPPTATAPPAPQEPEPPPPTAPAAPVDNPTPPPVPGG